MRTPLLARSLLLIPLALALPASAQDDAAVDAAPADAAERADAPPADPAPADAAPADTAPADAMSDEAAAPTEDPGATAAEDPGVVEEPAVVEESAADDAVTSDEPSLLERRIVAVVASGVSVTSLAVGAVFGFLAWQQYTCLQDVLACNETLADPIRGEDYFAARSDVEHKALIADMAYLFAAASALVAVTAFIRGFIFTGEEADETQDQARAPRASSSSIARAPALSAPIGRDARVAEVAE